MATEAQNNQRGRRVGIDDPPGRGVPALRTVLFLVVSAALTITAMVFVLQTFVAERLPKLGEAELAAAMKRWDANGPASYDLDIELRGARLGQVHVEVRNQEVTLETRDGRTPGHWTWDAWSVPGMFDTLMQDMQIAADPEEQIQAARGTMWRLRCRFEPQFGYPVQYHRLVSGGPEVSWHVTRFQPK